jgi:hypothetical protein
MTEECTKILKKLPNMERAALQCLWQELFGKAPHPKLRRQLLVPILAYRVQERAFGGLKPATRYYLRKLALRLENRSKSSSPRRIKPGTKLVREWHNVTYVVMVAEHGYIYDKREYGSLSEIASLITGTRWSGPLFFGLRQRGADRAK